MRKKAFTLIELLVVISIIALLMAILLPVLQRVKRQAKAVGCQSNLNQWGLIYAAYALDGEYTVRDDWDPEVPFWFPLGTETSKEWEISWAEWNDLRLCPMATKVDPIPDFPYWPFGATFKAWRADPVLGSYGVNPSLWPSYTAGGIREPYHWRTWFVKGASRVPFIFDCRWIWGGLMNNDDPPPQYEDMIVLGGWPIEAARRVCMNRHDGGIYSLFLDWSVRKVGLKELWTLKWNPKFSTRNRWTKAGGVQPEDWPKWMRRFKDY